MYFVILNNQIIATLGTVEKWPEVAEKLKAEGYERIPNSFSAFIARRGGEGEIRQTKGKYLKKIPISHPKKNGFNTMLAIQYLDISINIL